MYRAFFFKKKHLEINTLACVPYTDCSRKEKKTQ